MLNHYRSETGTVSNPEPAHLHTANVCPGIIPFPPHTEHVRNTGSSHVSQRTISLINGLLPHYNTSHQLLQEPQEAAPASPAIQLYGNQDYSYGSNGIPPEPYQD